MRSYQIKLPRLYLCLHERPIGFTGLHHKKLHCLRAVADTAGVSTGTVQNHINSGLVKASIRRRLDAGGRFTTSGGNKNQFLFIEDAEAYRYLRVNALDPSGHPMSEDSAGNKLTGSERPAIELACERVARTLPALRWVRIASRKWLGIKTWLRASSTNVVVKFYATYLSKKLLELTGVSPLVYSPSGYGPSSRLNISRIERGRLGFVST